MAKPTIASLQAEVAALKAQAVTNAAKLLDADQCAARALEGRDEMIRRCQALEGQHGIALDSGMSALRARLAAVEAERDRAKIEVQIARAQVRLMRLTAKKRG